MKEGERLLRSERYFGQVSRAFQLPYELDEGQSSASFKDGVLELKLAKKLAQPASKRLDIA